MRGVIDSQATSGSSRIKTALTDNELESFGTPDPRILVCGCGGSGNNTMNRITHIGVCLLYTSPSPRDDELSRMPSSA